MLQRQPNYTDSYIQILCRFQKCKRKVPPRFQNLPWGTKGKNLKKKLFLGGDGGGNFRLHFWNLHKIWI